MLALLKKTGSSAAKDAGVPWRADFRHIESLPDTKTVRTTFLINVVAFTVLGSLILWTAYREIALADLKKEIISVEGQILTAAKPNTTAEAEYKAFQAEEKKLKDIEALATANFSFPDYLIHLASLMPVGVKASRVDFRGVEQSIMVSGSVAGQDATASETASLFFKTLQEDEEFKKIFSSITNSNLGRNAATDTLSFELIFTFSKPVPVKK